MEEKKIFVFNISDAPTLYVVASSFAVAVVFVEKKLEDTYGRGNEPKISSVIPLENAVYVED